MKFITRLISVDEAIEKLVKVFVNSIRLDVESVDLFKAMGRVLAEDIKAEIDRPRSNISAVDGYALRSLDVISASLYNPIELVVKGVVRPGQTLTGICIGPGESMRVQTGAPLPCGADAVVMDEDVEVHENRIVVYKPLAQGTNVILQGEDFKKGEIIASQGFIVKPAIIATLAANGISNVKVYRKINISIIAVGDELIEPGEIIRESKEYNSAAYVVYSILLRDGIFNVKYSGIVPDNVNILEEAVLKEFSKGMDIVITTGGTGVSESDIIAKFVKEKGVFVFRGVKMRPGRPTSCSLLEGKPVIHFSGFPVAAWAGYEVLLRPAIIKWLGVRGLDRDLVFANLAKRLPNVVGYRSIIRVAVFHKESVLYAEPYMLRGSGVLSSLLKTNGYIIVPEDIEGFDKNTTVPVYLYD